jgi:hypothetical protein
MPPASPIGSSCVNHPLWESHLRCRCNYIVSCLTDMSLSAVSALSYSDTSMSWLSRLVAIKTILSFAVSRVY